MAEAEAAEAEEAEAEAAEAEAAGAALESTDSKTLLANVPGFFARTSIHPNWEAPLTPSFMSLLCFFHGNVARSS